MKKGRSPNYPRITFEDALGKVKRVYEQNLSHTASKEVVAEALGYGSINGGSLTMFGALKAYGLFESDGPGLRVADIAVNLILLPEDDPGWYEAVDYCVFHPDVFREIEEKYGEVLPSDSLMKHFLVTSKGYLGKAADEVIRVYRANLDFVNVIKAKYNIGDEPSTEEQRTPAMQQAPTVQHAITPVPAFADSGNSEIRVVFPVKGEIQIHVSGNLSDDSFDLMSLIRNFKKERTAKASDADESKTANAENTENTQMEAALDL